MLIPGRTMTCPDQWSPYSSRLRVHAGGAELYNAAVQLKEQLRGRAILLIADRPDIADVVEAEGVVLSPQGKLRSLAALEFSTLFSASQLSVSGVLLSHSG